MRSCSWPSAKALRSLAVAGGVLMLAAGCSGCGSGSGTSTAPSGNTLTGAWTGTLSRPDGLAPIAVRWQATRTDGPMSGPMTLTNGSSSVTFQLVGVTAGPGTSVSSIHFNFGVNAGAIATLPTCSILANDSVDAKDLREPLTTITTTPFTLNYFQCQGFVDPLPLSTFRTESTQLVMTKQ